MRGWWLLTLTLAGAMSAQVAPPAQVEIKSGWRLQDACLLDDTGAEISSPTYVGTRWHPAVVPGTVLTSLVADHVYPEPLYGANNRHIPESLARTDWWYRTTVLVPRAYASRRVWLNFDGINYAAEVWVNSQRVGEVRGAFIRGRFDITDDVKPGERAAIAVRISPQPHPGTPHEHTLKAGMGLNGGVTAIDGPTFLATIGWDWLPAIRDRDSGLWQRVYLSSTGDVAIRDPQVTSSLLTTGEADVTVTAPLKNLTGQPQHGTLRGEIGSIRFSQTVDLAPNEAREISFNPGTDPALHIARPQLWWPNGYGDHPLYHLKLTFTADGAKSPSDTSETTFGIRSITYGGDGENLTISVNGVRIFIRGGDWGMDEGMKRESPARMDAQMHLHALANLNMVRNWVGQSTSEAFYEAADRYGLLLWDEFFQPNPSDGPNPTDTATYLANARDKVLRFRNHPSIALWCGRNEGPPPKELDTALRDMTAELDPSRLYQPSSTDGRGVRSSGPYRWRTPREFYTWKEGEAFKTEIGSVSIPTLESIEGMLPRKDWNTINDDWAEHDFARGASGSDKYLSTMEARYGPVRNLADFARKGQLMNYEAFRAMYEGRNAKLFAPATGVITWMSNPAQPSFVWQLYHYDLEPNAALYAVRRAAEAVHVQLNEVTGNIEIINNTADPSLQGTLTAEVFTLDGTRIASVNRTVASREPLTTLDPLPPPATDSPVMVTRLTLQTQDGKPVSSNVYWQATGSNPDDLTALDSMPRVLLETTVHRESSGARTRIVVVLRNPTKHIALMAHLQLRRADGTRVLPSYADENYISLVPGESRTITIEAAEKDLHGQAALITLDGWNVSVRPTSAAGVLIRENRAADPASAPADWVR